MNRRDYEALADTLKQFTQGQEIAMSLVEYFERENPRFDRVKFINASRYDPDIMVMGLTDFIDGMAQSGALDWPPKD